MLFLYLQLTRKANITDKVSPINLPRRLAKVKPGMMCSVAGWGRLGVNMPSTDKLQEVDLFFFFFLNFILFLNFT